MTPRCSCPKDYIHEKAEGQNTKLTQVYTPTLAQNLCAAFQVEAHLRCPWRFDFEHSQKYKWINDSLTTELFDVDAAYLDCVRDADSWRAPLAAAAALVESQALPAIELSPGQDVYGMIMDLTPWRAERVQDVKLPKARRAPPEVPRTHRVGFLPFNDDEVIVETDEKKNDDEKAHPELGADADPRHKP